MSGRVLHWLSVAATTAVAIILWTAPGQAQPAVVQRALTLDDMVEIALVKNPGLRAAEREAQAAMKGHEAARGKLWPFADVFGDWQYSGPDEADKSRLLSNIGRMPRLNPTVPANRQFDHNIYAVGLRVTYPLYVGGRIVAQIEAHRLLTLLAHEQETQTADELIFNLSSTFFNVLRFQEDVKTTEASARALEETTRNVQSRVEVGRAARVDLLKVNTRLAAVRQDLTRVRNEVELGYAVLKTLMGLEVTEPLAVKGTLRTEPLALSLADDLREAERRRPKLAAARRAVEVQKQQVRIAKGARLPSVNLRAQYGAGAGESALGDPVRDFVAGVNISMPVFTGGELTAKVGQEEAKLARATEEFENVRLGIQLEVQTAHLQMSEARDRLATAQAALEAAREALRIEQLKTEVGRGTIEDFLDAQAAELQAEANVTRALADYNTAVVGRQRAIGRIRGDSTNGR